MALALATIQRQRSTLHFFILLPSPFGEGSGVRLRFPCLQFAKIKVFIVK